MLLQAVCIHPTASPTVISQVIVVFDLSELPGHGAVPRDAAVVLAEERHSYPHPALG